MNYRLIFLLSAVLTCYGDVSWTSQTSYLTETVPEDPLPYRVTVEQADFMLPAGIHSFAFAVYNGEWLFICGRTNGLHDVDNSDPTVNPFASAQRNTYVFVVNPTTQVSYFRSLYDSSSNLSEAQIDLLAVSNPLFCYADTKNTLYLVGGYGIDTATNTMTTKSSLTAIDVPNLINWVKNPAKSKKNAAACIRVTSHPLLQLAGGVMLQANEHHPFLLAFGQNYTGNYITSLDGSYSQQIRPIQIIDNGRNLYVQALDQPGPLATYRRRDLNVVPVVRKKGHALGMSFVALSGVFTPPDINDQPGPWTIPIEINPDGFSRMLDPTNPNTFAQGMNNYSCPTLGLYSQSQDNMYTLLFGGISGALWSDGSSDNTDPNPQCNCGTGWVPVPGHIWTICPNLPFTNDITTIGIDTYGNYTQYFMSGTYPIINPPGGVSYTPPQYGGLIPQTCGTNIALQTMYYFGASAAFIPVDGVPAYSNGVIAFDQLGKQPTVVGYIVGGIASTIRDTIATTDSQASPYVFKVTISPQ